MDHMDCRICTSSDLVEVLNLGNQYVSDFVTADRIHSGLICPIVLDLCRSCGLVQQRYSTPPEILYRSNYWYSSGTTTTMRAALKDVVDSALSQEVLSPGDVVLDIGSNDGTLLRHYPANLFKVGVEPAPNLVEAGRQGIQLLINDFWSVDAYLKAMTVDDWKPPRVVTACGMLYDLEDPIKFISDVARVMAHTGVFIAQFMGLADTIRLRDVGNLAHEHLEFYSLACLIDLYAKCGLKIYDVTRNTVNGGSYRIFAEHTSSNRHCITERLRDLLLQEDGMNLRALYTYRDLGADLAINSHLCRTFIRNAVANNKQVWVYGASTKGNVLLQYYHLDHTCITGAADRNPAKHGLYTVGSGIPIQSEEAMRAANPEHLLVLPYAFFQEFRERENTWLVQEGHSFLIPLPEFKEVRS